MKLKARGKKAKTRKLNHDEIVMLIGGLRDITPTFFQALLRKGFMPAICCGANDLEQIFGMFHPARAKDQQTMECPRCKAVHTLHRLERSEWMRRFFDDPEGPNETEDEYKRLLAIEWNTPQLALLLLDGKRVELVAMWSDTDDKN